MSCEGPRLEITVDCKGKSSLTVIGVPGGACLMASAPYDAVLGKMLNSQATADAYEEPEKVRIDISQE